MSGDVNETLQKQLKLDEIPDLAQRGKALEYVGKLSHDEKVELVKTDSHARREALRQKILTETQSNPMTPAAPPAAPPVSTDLAPLPGEEAPDDWEKALVANPDVKKEASPIIDKLHAIPILGPWILGLFLAPATMRALGKKPASFLETIMGFFKKPKTPEELEALQKKAKELLKTKYNITLTDAGKLANMKIAEFLKEKPEDFDQTKYNNLVAALKKNEAEKAKSDTTVIVFIVEKLTEWKE